MAITDPTTGIFYATTSAGVELPIVDVTHPAFAVKVTDEELAALSDQFVREAEARARLPGWVRRVGLWMARRQSRLVAGIFRASTRESFLGGLDTYLFKLGPDNLGAWATRLDRQLAGSIAGVSTRLRLQDVAQQLAENLVPRLAEAPGQPLRLINIGGGPAIDSVNALLLLRRDHPSDLVGRNIAIEVLDLDTDGPAFGRDAVAALQAAGAPLHGLKVAFAHTSYDWNAWDTLPGVLDRIRLPNALVSVSSEGALFEYGSDEAIVQNLEILRRHTPAGTCIAGSVTRGDGPAVHAQPATRIPTRPRSLALFTALAARAGWRVSYAIERPFSRDVTLVTAG